MDLFIITGTTRGLGHSIATRALKDGHKVISISRKNTIDHPNHLFIEMDLAKLNSLESTWNKFFNDYSYDQFKHIHLIQNAALLGPVGKVEQLPIEEIQNHIAVNFTAPVLLSKLFLNTFKEQSKYRTITNVGSGASTHAISGWGLYCATKSALSMFTNVCEKDYKSSDQLLKLINFNPGVMDTSMQEFIRSLKEENFPRVSEFISLKDNNQLKTTDKVAEFLLDHLYEPAKILSNSIIA